MTPRGEAARVSDRVPVVTIGLVAAIGYVAWFVTGVFPTESSIAPVAWSRHALAAGEWHRLAWSVLAHGGPIHLAVNLLALVSFGPVIERQLGHARFALVFAGAGVAGNFAHALLGPDVPVVGASGALFGLLGVMLVAAPLAEVAVMGVIPMPILFASAFYVAAVPTLAAFGDALPIAHEAHLGGLAFGAAAAAIMMPRAAVRVMPAAVAVFAAAWVGVAYALSLDFLALFGMDAVAVARALAPLAAVALVLMVALAYLGRVDTAARAAAR